MAAPSVPAASAAGPASTSPLSTGAAATLAPVPGRWLALGAAVLAALSAAALIQAWNTQARVKSLEAELVKRQQDAGGQAVEARTLARQAEVAAREVTAKLALMEARVAETSLQRGQLEELIQSLSRSRDENVLVDVEAAIRVALQQAAITGSADPLLQTLRQADDRLARYNQPRLEGVRRAVTQDLATTRASAAADVTALTMRLDEVMRQVDDLPLVAAIERGKVMSSTALTTDTSAGPTEVAPAPATATWWSKLKERLSFFNSHVWNEIRGLVRVSRIDQPEALLLAPEQAYFLRENLKLRLLNARLGLLSRQFESAQYDLRDAQSSLDRYFDRSSRRVVAASELLRQTAQQARQVAVPRPDATLAAIATAVAGR